MGLTLEDKSVAVPGETLATGLDYVPGRGTYRRGDVILASQLGLVSIEGRTIKLIPLSGNYIPKTNDTIIAKVTDITMSGWICDIRSAWTAMLPLKDATAEYVPKGADLTQFYTFGEYIVTKITNVTTQNLIDLSMRGPGLKKLRDGRIMHVTPCKVPRIIGKKGSMVSMIKQATGAHLIVGQNGVIWLVADDPAMELLASQTIKKIEAESHTSGLTDTIKQYLEKITGKTIEIRVEQ